MDELISRQDAIETALIFFVEYFGGAFREDDQLMLKKRMEELPSVQPRKGKWIDGMCSECEESTQDFLTNFCPNCGCRMEEGDSDDN